MKTDTCENCGKTIFLIQTGFTDQSYKWVTNPKKKDTWKCGHDPQSPLNVHHPKYPEADPGPVTLSEGVWLRRGIPTEDSIWRSKEL